MGNPFDAAHPWSINRQENQVRVTGNAAHADIGNITVGFAII
jgi:hypothetical protein